MNELEKEINENMSKIWIPANLDVVDETMVSFKGTKDNPHYVYIPCKPNPNGLKN
jgi:hypothetical protein